MTKTVQEFLEKELHLPKNLRDFHDQKELFKAIHLFMRAHKNSYTDNIDHEQGHCYVMDIFLPFMARHGYVLKKTTSKVDFDDLDESVQAAKTHRRLKEYEALKNLMGKRENHEKVTNSANLSVLGF